MENVVEVQIHYTNELRTPQPTEWFMHMCVETKYFPNFIPWSDAVTLKHNGALNCVYRATENPDIIEE
jgi:hypothetical protein